MSPSFINGSLSYIWTNEDKISWGRSKSIMGHDNQGDNDLHQHYLLEHQFTITFCNSDPMKLQIADIMSIAC